MHKQTCIISGCPVNSSVLFSKLALTGYLFKSTEIHQRKLLFLVALWDYKEQGNFNTRKHLLKILSGCSADHAKSANYKGKTFLHSSEYISGTEAWPNSLNHIQWAGRHQINNGRTETSTKIINMILFSWWADKTYLLLEAWWISAH